jgi:ribosomal-protein-alanine N-acetyltransferase
VFELQRLRPAHEAAVRDFELANRAYFARSISDRGDDFYENFAERYTAILAEQEAGASIFHVLVDEHETVVGRFNLYDILDGTAQVGYRVAQRVSGRGVATFGLQGLCRLAREDYRLRTLWATASNENVASQRMLARAGFIVIGPTEIGGRQAAQYKLALAGVS